MGLAYINLSESIPMLLDQSIKHLQAPWVSLDPLNRENDLVKLAEGLGAETVDVEYLLRVVILQLVFHLGERRCLTLCQDCLLR